jgi:N-acetyl-anhydromuramyl-L-alanine amidase AmpD
MRFTLMAAMALGLGLAGVAGGQVQPPAPTGANPHALPPLQRSFATRPGEPLRRLGDEIMVCGQLFHTSAPVVLWEDPGGYDAYRLGKRFADSTGNGPTRVAVGTRSSPLTDEEVEKVRGGNWTLPFLQEKVDQFVYHYDVCGLSRECFRVLHDGRGLTVHFMLDIDGTIYQTMDLKDQAAHATIANGRSIGIEIANMGAYPISSSPLPLEEWYAKDTAGTRITIPARFGDGGVRTPGFVGRPARPEMVLGVVQGNEYRQYDFTPQQYESLTRLTAALCTIFPKITCDYPRQKAAFGPPSTQPTTQPTGAPTEQFTSLAGPGEPGQLIPHALTPEQYDGYQGLLGHYHVQLDKQDPGPAFQWDRVVNGARALMSPQARVKNAQMRGKPARFIPSASQPATKPAATPQQPGGVGQ